MSWVSIHGVITGICAWGVAWALSNDFDEAWRNGMVILPFTLVVGMTLIVAVKADRNNVA